MQCAQRVRCVGHKLKTIDYLAGMVVEAVGLSTLPNEGNLTEEGGNGFQRMLGASIRRYQSSWQYVTNGRFFRFGNEDGRRSHVAEGEVRVILHTVVHHLAHRSDFHL